MMGAKDRMFTTLPSVTLEQLVPADHFYRRLEQTLDLSFVRDLVRDRYAPSGRPSIDPVKNTRGIGHATEIAFPCAGHETLCECHRRGAEKNSEHRRSGS